MVFKSSRSVCEYFLRAVEGAEGTGSSPVPSLIERARMMHEHDPLCRGRKRQLVRSIFDKSNPKAHRSKRFMRVSAEVPAEAVTCGGERKA